MGLGAGMRLPHSEQKMWSCALILFWQEAQRLKDFSFGEFMFLRQARHKGGKRQSRTSSVSL